MCLRYVFLVGLLILFLAGLTHAVENFSSKPSALTPEIQTISTTAKKCFKAGDRLQVTGARLLPDANRKLVILTRSTKSVPVSATRWTARRIDAKFPVSSLLISGERYPIVIVRTRDNRVISNSDKFIVICAPDGGSNSRTISSPKGRSETLATSTEPQETVSAGVGGFGVGSSSLPPATYVPVITELRDDAYEPGELVVISNDMPSAKRLAELVQEQNYRIKRRKLLKHLGFVISVIALPGDVNVADALKQLQQRDKSLLIDVNHRYSFASQAKKNSIQDNDNLQLHESIGWGKVSSNCGKGIRLGVLDSLVDIRHASFRKNQVVNKLLLPIGVNIADKQHATSIASILAGQVDSPVVGLLPAAKLYVAGVFRHSNDDRVDTTAELIVTGLDWLYSQKVHAINLSIAGPRNLFLEISIQRLVAKKMLIAAAVGNHGLENVSMFPAAINGVTGVTAIDVRKRIYNKANRGDFVQLAAPGVDIWVARVAGTQAYVSGTSFAVPYVAASLAILRQRNSKGSSQLIARQLGKKALDLGARGKDKIYGWGLLQFHGCP